jgi:hypothetical protein
MTVPPLVYAADGRLYDPYHLLDRPRPPAGSRHAAAWAQRDRDIAREERQMRAEILAAAADLDPADTSGPAEHLRAVADQARDHTDADDQRIAWAVAALQADPSLADRLPPSILDAAGPHLPPNTTTDPEDPRMTTTPTMSFRTTGTAGGGFQTQTSPFAAPGGLGNIPETASDLRAQARQADALAEQLHLLTGVINDWRGGLADRLAGATWGTEQITTAADALTGIGDDMTGLTDGLSALAQACQDAITVGAEATTKAATGAAEAFQAQ